MLKINREGQGCYLHCFLFFDSYNLRVEISMKKRGQQKKGVLKQKIEASLHTCIGDSRNIFVGNLSCKAFMFFHCFLVIKIRIASKSLLKSSGLSSCGSNWRKRYTLRLLLMCLVEREFRKLFFLGGGDDLPQARKDLPWGSGVGGNYTD